MKKAIYFLGFFLILLLSSCNKEETIIMCDACTLSPESGNCFAYFEKYYFDPNTQSCEVFVWGGCNGVIPFETLEECQNCGCK